MIMVVNSVLELFRPIATNARTSRVSARLKDHVFGGQMVHPISQLWSATGVPPHFVLSNEIKFLKEQNIKNFWGIF